MLFRVLVVCFLAFLLAPKADCWRQFNLHDDPAAAAAGQLNLDDDPVAAAAAKAAEDAKAELHKNVKNVIPTCPRYVPEQCDFSKCEKKLKCPGGLVKDFCGCCDVCAKQKGEPCGGAGGYLGVCDRRLVCELKPDVNQIFRADTGVCRARRDKMRCWTCKDANSLGECYTKGSLQTCNYNQKACQTHIRHDVTGLKYSMSCKQAEACSNNRVQNRRRAWRKTQCNLAEINSVCRCCCGHDRCNMDPKYQCFYETDYNRHDCVFPFQYLGVVYHSCTTKDWYTPWCSQDQNYNNRYVNCERYNGEECVFPFTYRGKTFHSCTSYDWHQPWCSKTYTYKGKWQNCDPVVNEKHCETLRLKLDLMIVLDASDTIKTTSNWDTEVKVASNILRNIVIEKFGTRVGIVHYNREVNKTSEVFLKEDRPLDRLDAHLHTVPPRRGFGTLTGKALKHALENSFSVENGNRPWVQDALILITDGRSQDEVVEATAALRKSGVTVYVAAVETQDRGIVQHTLDKKELASKLSTPAENFFMWDLKTSSPYNVHEAILEKMVKDDFCPRCPKLVNPDPENIDVVCTDDNLVGSICHLTCKDADTQGVKKTQCLLDVELGGTLNYWYPAVDKDSTTCNTCPRLPTKPYIQETGCKSEKWTNGCEYSCAYPNAFNMLGTSLDNGCQEFCCVPKECVTTKLLDLVIAIDSSSSIDKGEWNDMMDFVKAIVSKFDVGLDSVRVGMFRYYRTIDEANEVKLKETTSKQAIFDEIARYKRELGGLSGTATGLALEHAALNHLTLEAGDRPGVPNVVLVITDGKNNDFRYKGLSEGVAYERIRAKNQRKLEDGYNRLKNNHEADVFSVGVGMADSKATHTLLKAICGGIEDHFITITQFGQLKGEAEINKVIKVLKKSCGSCAKDESYIARLIYSSIVYKKEIDPSFGFVKDETRDNPDLQTGFDDWYAKYLTSKTY